MRSLLLSIAFFSALVANSQVSITATVGTTSGSYTTLKAAFDAINSGTHKGVLVISITGNTTETATASLSASGTGSSSYTSLTISPFGGAARSITGTIAGALINLNGADNVTIDGLNSNGNALTIENPSTSTSASAVLFPGGATSNVITNCNLLGSTAWSNGAYSKSGVVNFAGASNSNIQITYCNIGPSGSNKPSACINSTYHTGTTSNVTVDHCNIYDFYAGAGAANTYIGAGIYLGFLSNTVTNDSWVITNNSFYQTSTLTCTNSKLLGIYIHQGNNYNISNNYFGGSQPSCGGSAMTVNGTPFVMGFLHVDGHTSYLGIPNASGSNTLSGNTIANINFYTSNATSLSNYSDGARFFACTIHSGNWAITNNTVGSMTSNGSIVLEDANLSNYSFFHIYGSISSTMGPVVSSISGNNIGGITMNSTNADCNLLFISYESTGYKSQVDLVSNNKFGSTLANSISMPNLTNTSRYLIGVKSMASNTTSLVDISRNTFQNINLNNGSIYAVNSIQDISCVFNSFKSLTTLGATCIGIYVGSNDNYGSSTISRNFISDLKAATTITGIQATSFYRTVTLANNIITLGAGVASNISITGMYEYYLHNAYYNTIYIQGTGTSGTSSSFAYYRYSSWTGTTNVRNNIFVNARTNSGGTGTHYAAYFGATTTLTLDYNDYYVTGTGGKLAYYNSADINTFPSASLGANSKNLDPQFVSAGGTAATDYFISASLPAVLGTGITNDYSNNARSASTPRLGAWEINSQLPVSWLSFTGLLNHSSVVLNWATASEHNNSRFEIERSADALHFSTIGTVAASSTPAIRNDYQFIDLSPLNNSSFYRLKQVDADGKFSYSSIIQINGQNNAIKAWAVSGAYQLRVEIPQSILHVSSLLIYDASGRLTKVQQVLPGVNEVNMALFPRIQPYFIKVVQNGMTLYSKQLMNN
jgi:hypothetical protein